MESYPHHLTLSLLGLKPLCIGGSSDLTSAPLDSLNTLSQTSFSVSFSY